MLIAPTKGFTGLEELKGRVKGLPGGWKVFSTDIRIVREAAICLKLASGRRASKWYT